MHVGGTLCLNIQGERFEMSSQKTETEHSSWTSIPHGVRLREAVICLFSLCYEIYTVCFYTGWTESVQMNSCLWSCSDLFSWKSSSLFKMGRYTKKVRQIGILTFRYHKHVIFFYKIQGVGWGCYVIVYELSRLRWCHVGKFLILNLWVLFLVMMCR
jgi:hypothetical protein